MRCLGWCGSAKKRRHSVRSLGAPIGTQARYYIHQLVSSPWACPYGLWPTEPQGIGSLTVEPVSGALAAEASKYSTGATWAYQIR